MNADCNAAWLVDSHVHLHRCFDIGTFLDSARRNLAALAKGARVGEGGWHGALLFTESFGDDGFGALLRAGRTGAWTVTTSHDPAWLVARHDDGAIPIHIASGRQIVTRERLEVAALGTTRVMADGQPIEKVIDDLLADGTLLVLPWGFGKWTGKRGAIIERLLGRYAPDRVALGDNGGRAALSLRPPMFSKAESQGRIVLAGTDPLPFASEARRVGSYASLVPAAAGSTDALLASLRTIRETPAMLGSRAGLPYFVKSQIRMQLRKRA